MQSQVLCRFLMKHKGSNSENLKENDGKLPESHEIHGQPMVFSKVQAFSGGYSPDALRGFRWATDLMMGSLCNISITIFDLYDLFREMGMVLMIAIWICHTASGPIFCRSPICPKFSPHGYHDHAHFARIKWEWVKISETTLHTLQIVQP